MVTVTAKFADEYTGYLEIVYQLLSSYVTEPDKLCKHNVILRRVRVTVSVFAKYHALHIVTVCLQLQVSNLQRAGTVLQFVACLVLRYFPLYLIYGTQFGRDLLNTNICFDVHHNMIVKFSILNGIQRDFLTNVHRSQGNVSVILVRFH